jgi:hypothetical protein
MDEREPFRADLGRAIPSEERSEPGKPTDETRRPTWLEDVDEPPRRHATEREVPEPGDDHLPGADEEPIDPEHGQPSP